MMREVLVVGAGFAGATVARKLAEAAFKVDVIDQRDHLAGNCHTSRDESTGVMVHRYGPHIFHTDDKEVWQFINRFGVMHPFVNRVKAVNRQGIFSFPINLHTINQFLGTRFNPQEARDWIQVVTGQWSHPPSESTPREPRNFEEQALRMIGPELYEAFMKHYTIKQWGRNPREIPASVLTRLPLRFNYDDSYYNSRWQAIPVHGYTAIVERILAHANIAVHLSQSFYPGMLTNYLHTFYTGSIDQFFNFNFGRLNYRTVYFERDEGMGDLQGNAVLNYTDDAHAYTRTHEHKHFAPWESHERSVVFTEYSKETDIHETPFYPIRTPIDKVTLESYRREAAYLDSVTFLGRLGGYKYMDMDGTIREALNVAHAWLSEHKAW